jgi:hypothetical protein
MKNDYTYSASPTKSKAKRPFGALSIAQGNALWDRCYTKQSGCKPDIKKLVTPQKGSVSTAFRFVGQRPTLGSFRLSAL